MSKKIGLDCMLYVDATPIAADADPSASTWDEVKSAKDVSLNLDAGEADVTTRGNSGWRATRATLRNAAIEFELAWDTDDTQLCELRDAYLTGAAIAIAVMDGDITVAGAEGFVANFRISAFNRNEPLEEGVTASVTAKPESEHQWYEVEA